MKKLFIVSLMVLSLVFAGNAFATDGCDGPDCSAEGNFDISTFAIGGGISYDGVIEDGGAAGGIGVAGGIAGAKASGHVESFEVPVFEYVGRCNGDYNRGLFGYYYVGHNRGRYDLTGYRTVMLGHAEGALSSAAGGFTKTEAYTFDSSKSHPEYQEVFGVGSWTENREARATQWVDLSAFGKAGATSMFAGAAGQGSLNGAIITPADDQNVEGHALAVAGQGSLAGYYGFAGTGLIGSVEVDTGAVMNGFSEADAYRATYFFKGGKTEILLGYTHADTQVYSGWNNINNHGLAGGYVNGGWVAGGVGYTASKMTTDMGYAKATASGSYNGSGQLGCDFNGMLDGYSKTQSTTLDGYNGTVMRSSAGMRVEIGGGNPQ